MNPVFGNNSTYWLSCASPRNLPILLSALPNSSYISVLYGSQYSYPDTRLSVVDISSLSMSMQVKQSADCVNVIVSSSPTSANYDDFQRILLAMLFPIQVQLRIVYDGKLASGIAACSALCAKLLLSSSPLTRNVLWASSLDSDMVISDWLVSLGYQRLNRQNPLQLTYAPRGQAHLVRDSEWHRLASVEGIGVGWLNHEVVDFLGVANPLYDGVNRMPQYGGVISYFDPDNYGDTSNIPDVPIFCVVRQCLHELAIYRVLVITNLT